MHTYFMSCSGVGPLVVTPADIVVALAAAALAVALTGSTKTAALTGLEHCSRNFGLRTRKSVGLSSRKCRGEAGQGDQEGGGEAQEAHGRRFG